MGTAGPAGQVPSRRTGRPCSELQVTGRGVGRAFRLPWEEARISVEISVARKLLEALRDDLDKSILVLQAEHPRLRGGGMEAGDAGATLTEADRNEAAVESFRTQRAEIMAALSRVEDGSYGKCVDCGQLVPDGRLEARPTTARCVACQGKRDRRRR